MIVRTVTVPLVATIAEASASISIVTIVKLLKILPNVGRTQTTTATSKIISARLVTLES